MGKFRPRVAGKGKRWKKGHSSSSNPEIQKYREAARSRFFQVQESTGPGELTTDAVQKHNAFLGTKMDTETVEEDEESQGGTFKTFQTFASDWTMCSNKSFGKLLNGFRSDSALHKEMLAVLAAVTEVIKQNGGTESVTEYFGALMTTIEVSESEESLAAILSLLGMGIKSVPQTVLQAKFSETSKCFVDLLGKFAESDNNVILQSLIGCLSVILRAQQPGVWSDSSTMQVLDSLLAFTTHTKPRVRKAAQHAVCAVLKGSAFMAEESPPLCHPGAAQAANFCIRQIEAGGSLGGSTTTLHMLVLLKEILGTFPKTQLKLALETILKVMTLGNVLVTSCSMQALHGLFLSRPSPLTLVPALNGQMITALFDYQPSANDTQPTLAWLAVMQEACINLSCTNLTLCCAHLPRLFSTVSQLWLSEKPEVTSAATRCLLSVTQDCVGAACATTQLARQHRVTIDALITTVHGGLQYQYHSAWQQILHLMATFFEAAGKTCSKQLTTCLKSLADLRDSYQFTFANELENAVCKAVRSMGPEAVLQVIPLQITGQETSYEFRRSWLLPVLKSGIAGAKIGFFASYFLPLATNCRRQGLAAGARNDMVAAHSYDLLQSQIWSLLPSFANKPPDLAENFKNMAKVLGSALRECKDLRISVLTALRRLITCSQEKAAETGDHADVKEMARFAKNFVPILFNVFTTKAVGSDEEGQRLASYETIKLYLEVTDPELRSEFFDKAFIKLNAEESDEFVKECVLDLLRALLPYQTMDRVQQLYGVCEAGIMSSRNHHIQKKSYKILEAICSGDSVGCRDFVEQNLATMQKILLKSLSKSATSSKGPRLRCLLHLISRLGRGQMSVLELIVPEAVLCCKDLNEKCRSAAFTLLVTVGKTMAEWEDKPMDDIMRDYLALVLAGLAGSPQLTSATVLALAKITYEFRATLPEDLVLLLLDNICILATTSTREIVGACLSYIKVFTTSFTTDEIAPSVPTIVKGMLSMTDDCKRYLRNKYRNIFDRLIRKFGWKAISDLVPQSETVLHKRLKNLRKQQDRKKKLRNQDRDSDSEHEDFVMKAKQKTIEEILAESDASDDEKIDERFRNRNKSTKTSSAWIQEDADNIVDFTDASAAKKIRATNPVASTSQETKAAAAKSEIKTASDGRLIIVDENDGDDEDMRRTTRRRNFSDSESETEEAKDPTIGRKRKRGDSGTVDGRSVTSRMSSKYQAGGSGIHRPIKKKAKGPAVVTGSEYKSTKAAGDVKRKGRPDPYAYVPMSRKMLNKRNKGKSSGQFKNLVRGVRKTKGKGEKKKGKR